MQSVPSAVEDKNRTNDSNDLFSTSFRLLMKTRMILCKAKTKVMHEDKMTIDRMHPSSG